MKKLLSLLAPPLLAAVLQAQSPGPLDLNEGLVLTRTPINNAVTPWNHEINFGPRQGVPTSSSRPTTSPT